jgi:hypothetical protein
VGTNVDVATASYPEVALRGHSRVHFGAHLKLGLTTYDANALAGNTANIRMASIIAFMC